MNWFTHDSGIADADSMGNSDCCEHVQVGDKVHIHRERDSFGIVGQYMCCQACHEKAEAENDETDAVCNDCGETKKTKDVRYWKWYDFYAPQGDEPLCVCRDCWSKDKHQRRMAKDAADQEAEDDYYSR